MTVRECYAAMQADYDEALERLGTEHLVERFMLKYIDDKSMELLENAVISESIEDAFRAAHTLKGVAANLSFKRLQKAASDLTEQLRPRSSMPDPILLDELRKTYKDTIDLLEQYKNGLII